MAIRRARPIADKVLRKIDRYQRSKVVDLKAFREGRQLSEYLDEKVSIDSELQKLHPAHALYAYAQNRLSIMAEQLTALPELDRLTRPLSEAEDAYMPQGPPMSPLTASFYTCWTLFDISAGIANETLGTISIAVGRKCGMHQDLLHLFTLMQDSHMGVFRHEGLEGNAVILRDLVTDQVSSATCATGYSGQPGELWYVRLMPPPAPEFKHHVVFTTPYMLLAPAEAQWLAYFDRVLPPQTSEKRINAYKRHMKFGPPRDHWSEFVFEAYVNYQADVIFLQGLPDIEESRPHSRINS